MNALSEGRLSPGKASKLAGKLSWGACALFHRVGRAMLRPLFDQKSRRDGKMCAELERALRWWLSVLHEGLSEKRRWRTEPKPVVHLFCDARGTPPHLAAVLFDEKSCYFTHMTPPESVLAQFQSRKDAQIVGLELLAISLGLCTFEARLSNRCVVVHPDNTGSECSVRRGTARSFDHAQLVHEQWLQAARHGMELVIRRVSTKDNIADLPSRPDADTLETMGAIGAKEVPPVLADPYLEDATWQILWERWKPWFV